MCPVIGLVTIGQSPRVDVVPDMAETIGPGVEVREAGALDGLGRAEIDALAPGPDDEILVTRLRDGASVFVGRRAITPHVERQIAALERAGVTLSALLCTGAFPRLAATRPLIQPQPVLLGALRGMSWPGRLGILTPSVPHVPQTEARWRADGFDPVVVPLSPYDATDATAVSRAAATLREGVGLVVMDCMGYRRKTRDEIQGLLRMPVLAANLLVARLIAELYSA
ncbi:MAG: AroM family protein [Candidatus Rokuibacteriota bacterium]